MPPKTITVIGSLNIDLVTLTPRVPAGGETLTATSFSTGPGGKGANQAVACARLSRPNPASTPSFDSDVLLKMIGAVGDDEYVFIFQISKYNSLIQISTSGLILQSISTSFKSKTCGMVLTSAYFAKQVLSMSLNSRICVILSLLPISHTSVLHHSKIYIFPKYKP